MIQRLFKGTYTLCQCGHGIRWKEGESGCNICLRNEGVTPVVGEVMHPNSVKNLRPGVRTTKNGKHFIPGKGFIKESEAYY